MNNIFHQFMAPAPYPILAISIHSNNEWLAVGQLCGRSPTPTLTIVKQQNGELIAVVEKANQGEGSVYRVMFHPDETRLFYVIQQNDNFHLKVHNMDTQESSQIITLGMRYQGLSIDKKGKTMIALGEHLHIWTDGEHRAISFDEDTGDLPLCAGLSPDGKFIAMAGLEPGQIALFDAETAKIIKTFSTAFTTVGRVEFDRSSQYVGAMNDFGRGVYLWNIETGERFMDDLFGDELALTSSFRFSPATDHLILGHVHDYVVIHDLSTGNEICVDHPHQGRVEDVCFSNDGRYAVSAGEDHQIIVRQL